jgi:hypothetical protein
MSFLLKFGALNSAPAESKDAGKHKKEWRFTRQLLAFFTFVFFIVPSLVVVFSFFFGLILAKVEGWPIIDGFYYVTSMLCGLPEPLTLVEPQNTAGKIMDIIISIWSLAVAGTVIGVVAGMSIISEVIEIAEGAFARKKIPGEGGAAAPSAEAETKELAVRIAALEVASRRNDELLQKIYAATCGGQ